MGNRQQLESRVFQVREALEKAWYVSNLGENYFDLRDLENLSQGEAESVLLGYAGAAMEHDVVHDYLTAALRETKELERMLMEA